MCWFAYGKGIVVVSTLVFFGALTERAQAQPSDDVRHAAVEEIPPTVPGQGTPADLPPPAPIPEGPAVCPPEPCASPWAEYLGAWGLVGGRIYKMGERVAPNGQIFDTSLGLEMLTNVWLCRRQRLYIISDWVFWGQRAAEGITNDGQGALDFSKREFDMTVGVAWNYWERFEGRVYAYSYNNLNRGLSETVPEGFKDGTIIENRYYLNEMYDRLGTPTFDIARAPYVSIGYHPSKELVDLTGERWRPGFFASAYLTLDVYDDLAYLYADTSFILSKGFTPKHWVYDGGVALRPFANPHWEARCGVDGVYDLPIQEWEFRAYIALRYIF